MYGLGILSFGDYLRLSAGFFRDFGHGIDEVVHGFLGFGFGRLDQEAFGHQQREVDGGGVLVVVEQVLGDVERGDFVVLGLFGEGEDEFVAGAAIGVDSLAADGFEVLEQVVGGKGGVFADALDLALLRRTIFRRRRSVNGLQVLTENSYRSAEGALLRWQSVLEHTYCQQSPYPLDLRYCNARDQSMVGQRVAIQYLRGKRAAV